jgi:hypothetical protein
MKIFLLLFAIAGIKNFNVSLNESDSNEAKLPTFIGTIER